MAVKILVKFNWEVGRMGRIESLFVTTQKQLDEIIGKEIYFGEVLGKHSEVYGTLNKEDLSIITDDQEFINKLIAILGKQTISGHNPFHYLREDENE